MNKAVILLSGTPQGKSRFDEIIKKISWVWNINPRNFLGALARNFYWQGERNEQYYKFTAALLLLVNEYFNFEEKYIREKIEKFYSDDSQEKIIKGEENKTFSTFILIIHGISKNLVNILESDYGVFQLHISRRDLNTNIEEHDYVLYEDDEDFEEQVNRVLHVLTNNEKEGV